MKASDIITRALNLADLQNAAFLVYNDKAQSIFESFRDIYTTLIDAEDDFFLVDTQVPITPSMQSANQSGSMVQEWLIPLPDDFLRGRYVFYRGTQSWMPMDKFAILDAVSVGSPPRYRFQNANLWVVGTAMFSFGTVRLGYYPKQPVATVPDSDYVFGAGITQLSNRSLVTYPAYCDAEDSLLYVYNGTSIEIDSLALSTFSTLLYTGASAISYLTYYAGFVYFLMGGDIYRAPFLQTGTLVPVKITTVATITSFSLSVYDQLLYYTDGTNIYSIAFSGGAPSTVSAVPGSSVYNLGGQFTFYVDPSGNLKTITGTTLATGVAQATTDGSMFIFYVDTKRNLWSALVATVNGVPTLAGSNAAAVVTSPALLRSGVSSIGPFFASGPVYPGEYSNVVTGRIPLIDQTLNMLAISPVVDYDFGYPLNEANEIMAYQCAIDFRRKSQRPFDDLLLRLGQKAEDSATGKASGIWARLESSLVRKDEFRPERAANVYAQRNWW